MDQFEMEKKLKDLEKKFEGFSTEYQQALSAAMAAMSALGNIAGLFRMAEGDDRKKATDALEFLHELAPTRHKKELAKAMRNAVERHWFEADNNMLPVKGESAVAH